MTLKEQMEEAWKTGGCENPLVPAWWGLGKVLQCLNSIRWNYWR